MPSNKKTKNVPPTRKPAKQGKKTMPQRNETIAVVQKSGPRIPQTVHKNGSTVVTHTETYGVNVTGSDPFAVFATWALQPAIKQYNRGSPLGQWLPEIAGNFDNYEIESLRFKFRTACSTLTTGLAVFGFEPNPEGSVPTTYQEIRNMYSVDGSVHSNLMFDVSSRVRKKLLTRKGAVVSLPSYDAGKVYFATIGVTGNALIGFVDVEYRVRLFNPQASITSSVAPPTNPGLPNPIQRWTWDASSMPELDCALSSDAPFAYFAERAVATGALLFGQAQRPFSAVDQTIEAGCAFKNGASASLWTFGARTAGRYRLRFTPKWDWQDLKMFCLAPFVSTNTSPDRVRGTYQAYASVSGGELVNIPCSVYTHRGFTGTAVGDPNPGTDVWPTFVWDVTLNLQDDIGILIGKLNYNSVSTEAKVTGRANLGLSELVVEYLGVIQAE